MITNKLMGTNKRITFQRVKILEYLRSVKTHPSAEVVYAAVKKDLPTISLATVYRNLNLLADQGEILKIDHDHGARYDGFSHHHQHFICKSCDKIIDIEDDKAVKYALKNLPSSLKADNVHIIFEGNCNNC